MALVTPLTSLSETELLQIIAGALVTLNPDGTFTLIPFAAVDTDWGAIGGTITDQTDLIALIASSVAPNVTAPIIVSSTTVDLESHASTTLYTVPTNKTFILTDIVMRQFSADPAGARMEFLMDGQAMSGAVKINPGEFGVSGPGRQMSLRHFDNLNGGLDLLDVALLEGLATQDLVVNMQDVSTGAATCVIDVFGYHVHPSSKAAIPNVRG